MRTIKVRKLIEEMPLKIGVDLCTRILEKRKGISERTFKKQIRADLVSGKKKFRIRELILLEKP